MTRLLHVAVVLAAAAGAAAFSTAAPTGIATVDLVERAAFAGLVAAAACAARPWTAAWLAGLALAAAPGGSGAAPAVAVLLVALAALFVRTWATWLSAVAGAAGGVLVLRLGDVGPPGATALVAVAAVVPTLVSGWRQCDDTTWQRLRRLTGVVGIVAGVLLVLFGASAFLAWRAAGRAVGESTAWVEAARSGDQEGALEHLRAANVAFDDAHGAVTAPWASPARVLPGLGRYLEAVGAVSSSGAELSRVTTLAGESTDIDDLRPRGGRFDLGALAQARAPLSTTVATARAALARVDAIDDTWLAGPVRDRIGEFRTRVAEAESQGDIAVMAIDAAPALLGQQGQRRYLVVFTTPSETRELGGFMGNFAELTVTDGKLDLTRSGRTSVLNAGLTDAEAQARAGQVIEGTRPADQIPHLSTDAGYPERYVRYDIGRFWQNITGTPDFPTVARAAAELYPKSGGQAIDGVIAVDPRGLAAMLKLTGSISVEGLPEKLTPENAADFLLRRQYLELGNVTARADLLDRVSRTTFERITTGDLPGPRAVGEALGPMVEGRHLLFWSLHPTDQPLLTRLGLSGAMAAPSPDFVAVTQANDNPSKADVDLRRDVSYEATYDQTTSKVQGTVKVVLHNGLPTGTELGTLPDYVAGNARNLPRGTNRTFLSAYVALPLASASVDGKAVPIESYQEYGRNRFGMYVDVPPSSSVEVVFRLDGTLDLADGYGVTVWSPPLVTPDHLTVTARPVPAADGGPGLGGVVDITSDKDGVLQLQASR